MKFPRLLCLFLLPLTAIPAVGQTVDFIPEIATTRDEMLMHERCVSDAERNPAEGFEKAMAWRDASGSNAARHCVAAALFYLGQPAAAADRLEQLGIGMRAAGPELRARILDQAGTAWLAARELERANAVLTTAIGLAPYLPDLYVDRSAVLGQAANYWEAIDDLNKAIELEPRYGIAYAFRAAAYRFVDSIDLATEDAERAIRVAPDLPEGWLERGILRRLKGDVAGARSDWLRVLVLDPDGNAGDAARANIERLELRLDEKPANLPARPGRR